MDQKSYQMGGVLLLSFGMVSGCASPSQANTGSDNVGSDGAVEMVVANRTQDPVRMYANWEDVGAGGLSRRSRLLGELPGGETGRYTIPYRWRGVSLSVEPVMRQARDPRADPLGPNRDPLPRGPVVEIGPGDRLEWVIRGNGAFYSAQLIAHERGR